MRRKVTKLLVVVTVIALFAWLASFAFADNETLGKAKMYSGTVSFRYGAGFVLTTEAGAAYKLMLGPPWYLDDLGLKIKNGDKVTIKGVVDDNDAVLFVGTLKKGAKTYDIANLEGLEDFHRSPMMMHGWGIMGRGYYGRWGSRGNWGWGPGSNE